MVADKLHSVVVELIAVRLAWNMTQADLADLIGVHKNTMTKYETGVYQPKLSHLIAWANALGYDLTIKQRS